MAIVPSAASQTISPVVLATWLCLHNGSMEPDFTELFVITLATLFQLHFILLLRIHTLLKGDWNFSDFL